MYCTALYYNSDLFTLLVASLTMMMAATYSIRATRKKV